MKKYVIGCEAFCHFVCSSRADAEEMIATLMGDNIDARKKYITANANFNKVDAFEARSLKK